jgi:hypothetical protein
MADFHGVFSLSSGYREAAVAVIMIFLVSTSNP